MQNKASLLLQCCLLMRPGGVKGLSLMSLEVLSIMLIIDVIRSTNSAAIALHVFMRIILNFPAIEQPWARSLLQLPEPFVCVTS